MLALLAAWAVAAGAGAWCLLRVPPRRAIGVLFAGTVMLHAAALTNGPQLSDDVYRYAWDGRVQAAGIDPYRYPPDDARLVGLRDEWLWPDAAGCAELKRPPGCTRLNRASERTIYPPVAQVWFRLLDLVLPAGTQELGYQVAHGALGLVLTALLVKVTTRLGGDPRWAVFYAWSPIAVVEAAMDAHVDVLATALVVLALWWLARRPTVAGALMGAAAAIKLFPAVVLPVMLRRRPGRVVAGAAAVVVIGYLPHVIALGPRVLGYLPGYLREERYADGGRFLLLGLVGLKGSTAAAAALVIGGVVTWRLMRNREASVAGRACQLLGAAFLVATPVQPWYGLLLVALVALCGSWPWLAVAAAAYPLYFAAVLDAPTAPIGAASYGVAGGIVAVAAINRRRTPRPAPIAATN